MNEFHNEMLKDSSFSHPFRQDYTRSNPHDNMCSTPLPVLIWL